MMQPISQEVTFAALRPLMQDIVVDSDLEVRMQQDNSLNLSIIYTIFTQDLSHSHFTWAWWIQEKSQEYFAYADIPSVQISLYSTHYVKPKLKFSQF